MASVELRAFKGLCVGARNFGYQDLSLLAGVARRTPQARCSAGFPGRHYTVDRRAFILNIQLSSARGDGQWLTTQR